jgi:hypothetical protein
MRDQWRQNAGLPPIVRKPYMPDLCEVTLTVKCGKPCGTCCVCCLAPGHVVPCECCGDEPGHPGTCPA